MRHKYTLLLFFVCLSSCGYYQDPEIQIVNQSGAPIYDVVLTGNGFRKELGTMNPGEKRKLKVQVKGESGLSIQFRNSSGMITSNDLAYIESKGGYRVTLLIDGKHLVTSKTELKRVW